MEKKQKSYGQQIVVLTAGFVYVGDVERNGDMLFITRARNIRRWGTTKGLGELCNGPLETTILDECGDVIAPMNSVIHLMQCTGF